jgi:hypothetical protein
MSPLLFNSGGNLYGTTELGGVDDDGSAFELSPSSNGWTETVVYSFTEGNDGGIPQGSIVLDDAGNLYGTTPEGGSDGYSGTAFELSPAAPGQPWTETTLADIGTNGNGLVRGKDGNLYGSTSGISFDPPGTVFQLTLSGGVWTKNVIYTFVQTGGTSYPGPINIDANLNIYLPAFLSRCGDLYKLSAMPGNTWKPSLLYAFPSQGAGGCDPVAALTIGKWGALYGTTSRGGPLQYFDGVVFGVAP